MAYVIGLCGGIGSGKSAVSAYLEKKGYPIIDADLVARVVVKKGSEGLKRLVDCFGKGILNGSGALDRKALGELIFSDEAKRLKVNELLHPLIEAHIVSALKDRENERVVFLVVPLFFEAGYERYVDEVFYVSAEEGLRLKRIASRDKISSDLAFKKIKSQLSEEAIISRYHPTVIQNNGTIEALEKKVSLLLEEKGLGV